MSGEVAKPLKGGRPIYVKALKITEDGRSLHEQIEDVKKQGIYLTPKVLRNSIIGGLEIRKKGASPENLIMIGCMCYGTAIPLRAYCLLLNSLGIEYNFLDKEYCCGQPLIESELFIGDGKRDMADQAAKEFIGLNIALARALGAKRMIYFCPWCVYQANRFYPDSDIPQLYSMDLLASILKDKKLHVEPTTIGYFGGTPHRLAMMFPKGTCNFKLDWNSYRQILDHIEGLQVINIPRYCCSIADWAIWKFAQEKGLDKIITTCPSCYSRLMRRAPPGIRVWHIPQFLLRLLDPEKATM